MGAAWMMRRTMGEGEIYVRTVRTTTFCRRSRFEELCVGFDFLKQGSWHASMLCRMWAKGSLLKAHTTPLLIVGIRGLELTMEARVGVRRSARLIKSSTMPAAKLPRVNSNAMKKKKDSIAMQKKEDSNAKKKKEDPNAMKKKEDEQKPVRTKALKRFPSRDLEMKLWELGFQNVAGVDEAGRGPLAGPVVAAACIIPASVTIAGVDDSKKLTESQREELHDQIIATPGIVYAIHVVDAAKIDEINILQATLLAMSSCIKKLKEENDGKAPDYVLADGNRLPDDLSKEEAQFVIKGDAECHVIAAASILAKVTRDRMMLDYDKKWPVYGFKAHKGYGTAIHMGALLKHGPCDIHRRSFAPLKDRLLQAKNGGS